MNEDDATVFTFNGEMDQDYRVLGEPDLLRTKGGNGFQRTIEGNLFAFYSPAHNKWMTFEQNKSGKEHKASFATGHHEGQPDMK